MIPREEDTTELFIDVPKDEKGVYALEYGLESDEEYIPHFECIVLNAVEYFPVSYIFIEMFEEIGVFPDPGEFSTLLLKDIPKATKIVQNFAKKRPQTKNTCEKILKMFDLALKYNMPVEFS